MSVQTGEPIQRDVVLPMNPERPEWMDDGNCAKPVFKTVDFFLEGRWPKGSRPYIKARDRAKAVCRSCPVRETCLQYALEEGIRDGIWGGRTGSERRNIRYPKRLTLPDGTVYVYPREVA